MNLLYLMVDMQLWTSMILFPVLLIRMTLNITKYSHYQQQHESNKTPHASLKKKTMTPGASLRKVPVFHLGGTPATSLLRVPQFHTGLTPKASAKNQASMVLKQDKPENCGPFHRPHGAFKNGRSCQFLGV